ncbi:MAG: endolytic transglycosylase MltG [Candidatus Roizmanbacteria bacterium]|nr:endolytic transglycosylase MltG [Candidatus Roizmanbacteria bacterium]
MKKLMILVILFLCVGLVGFLLFREGTLPVNKSSEESIVYVVDPGENLDSIINNLSKADLIRNRVAFYLVVKQLGIERKIQAGDFRLSPSMNAYEIADGLTHGSIDLWVTVPEGLRKEEIAEIMSKSFNVSETEFNLLAQEGYLFPDTYLIPRSATAQDIIDIMRANYESKYTSDIAQAAKNNGLSEQEVLILASIVEKETLFDSDRSGVASVLLRRLRENYPLEVDVTIQYALGYQKDENRWWKSFITYDDLEVDSPYNNYKNIGLPPTPISNPGIASIRAAAEATENTPYKYYLADKEGHVHFGKTFEEHQQNIVKYLR